MQPIVVVGGGAAAHRCIGAYRDADGSSPMILISADDRLPYFRPHLTKELMAGVIGVEGILLDDPSWYAQRDVEVRLEQTAVALDLANRIVATADGPVAYGQLVIATGSSAKPLPVEIGTSRRVFSVRSAKEALDLLDSFEPAAPVAVIGSGFIGCEIASSLRTRGAAITMITNEAMPQVGRLGAPAGRTLMEWLTGAGIAVRTGTSVQSLQDTRDGVLLRLSDGSALEASIVVAALGAQPNVALAADAGLPCANGILVDSSMRTNATDVFAVGDIAFAEHAIAGRRLRVEHWGDAEEMGRIAATTLSGHPDQWSAVSGFWTVITGNELKYVAWGDGWDALDVRESDGGFTIWYGSQGLTVGALTYDHDGDNEIAGAVIQARTPFPPP